MAHPQDTRRTSTLKHVVAINGSSRKVSTQRLLDEISFAGSELAGRRVVIDGGYVRERLDDITQDTDLSRFIL